MTMTKAAVVLGFLLLAAVAAPLRGPCDLKLVEKKTWCPKCLAYVPRGDVRGGSCPKDRARVETHDICVKQIYVAKCHSTTTGLKPVVCCGVTYDKPTDDVARVVWTCAGCPEKSYARDFKHPDICSGRKVTKSCEKSGTAPHSSLGK